MLHAIRTLLQKLHSRTLPAFHVTQLIGSGQRRTLHLDHAPGRGYTVYEMYVDPREQAEQFDHDTWETTLSRQEALAIFRDSGACLEAMRVAQANESGTILVPDQVCLEFIFSDAACRLVSVPEHQEAQSLLAEIGSCDQVQAVRGWSADHEVPWQAVFDRREWGAEARMAVHQLLSP